MEQWLEAFETRRVLDAVDAISHWWEKKRFSSAWNGIAEFESENRRYRIERENAVRKDAEPLAEAPRAKTGSGRIYKSTSSETLRKNWEKSTTRSEAVF